MNTIPITVYSMPSCAQCRFTKKWLDDRGITYDEVDLTQDAQALDAVHELGYRAAPVVFASPAPGVDVHWYGFQPDMLAQHCTVKEAAA